LLRCVSSNFFILKTIPITIGTQASITIDGICYVVDSGFVKVGVIKSSAIVKITNFQIRNYNPTTNLASLITVPISLASAIQRAGRAGRTSNGVCYRLYTEMSFQAFAPTTSPEITRSNLITPILQLKSLGIDDLMKFEWLTPPPAESVLRALESLISIEAINSEGHLTAIGEQIAEYPVEASTAVMVSNSNMKILISLAPHMFSVAAISQVWMQ